MDGKAHETLRGHLSRQIEEMDRLGDPYRDQGLVFTTNSSAPLNPSNIRNRNLRRLTRKAGLQETRVHDLRRTCVSLLLSKNVHPRTTARDRTRRQCRPQHLPPGAQTTLSASDLYVGFYV